MSVTSRKVLVRYTYDEDMTGLKALGTQEGGDKDRRFLLSVIAELLSGCFLVLILVVH
jgi:hypothetical protein